MKTTLRFILLLSAHTLPAVAWSSGLTSQTSIVDAYLTASQDQRRLAEALAEQASKIDQDNLGPLVKAWCGSAASAPNPVNLAECARFRFKLVDEMSNPQPSREAARMHEAKTSLMMVRAALEIAEGETAVSDAYQRRLQADAECYRAFIAGAGWPTACGW